MATSSDRRITSERRDRKGGPERRKSDRRAGVRALRPIVLIREEPPEAYADLSVQGAQFTLPAEVQLKVAAESGELRLPGRITRCEPGPDGLAVHVRFGKLDEDTAQSLRKLLEAESGNG
jgi:hypothetical protein